ncbi:MAG: PqiC family protein [Puniceicoccales bacterium]
MRNIILAPLLFVSLLALGGCSIGDSSSPSRFYVLTPMPEGSEAVSFEGEPPSVGLTRVQIPSTLDRPQMVIYTAPNEVKYNEFNRWSEPLSQGIGETIRRNLLVLMGPGKVSAFPWMQTFPRDYNVQVIVQEFGAYTYRNEVVLRAVYRIERLDGGDRETVAVSEVTYTQPIAGNTQNFDDIVNAESQTLIRLSKDIASEIKKLDSQAQCSGDDGKSKEDSATMPGKDDTTDAGKGMLKSHYRTISTE